MIAHRNIGRVIGAAMIAAVLVCILAPAFFREAVETSGGGMALQYESELFGADAAIQIDIQMEEGQWEDMLANAMAEEYYACDVEINGRKLYNVGIRPKGNTSLSAIVADPDSDRFSLKLEFDHYVDGQTCLGLDKLILNNNYVDATNMKEAIVYDMYHYLGADASLYNYAEVSVNGEYWGVHLALEAVEESFLLRNYGAQDGELYKPEGVGGGAGMGEEGRERPNGGQAGGFQFPGGVFSMDGGGANLNYTDEDLDSYSTIWDGEVTDTGKGDHRRVVTALKNIGEGTELEEYLDIDNVLRYMAVHVFSVNMDSLSGNMAHNYYLYESGGMLNILPWDYNLAFGGMGMGTADGGSGIVNDAIDTPFQGTAFFDALLEDEEYCSRYHEYLRQLAEEYVLGGRFQEAYGRIRGQIDSLVEADPTAFYSCAEYEEGAEMLYQTVMLRAESVLGQLDGSIPSTDEGQRMNPSALVDASEIDVEAMGMFDMGGGGARFGDIDAHFSEQGGETAESVPGIPDAGVEFPQRKSPGGMGGNPPGNFMDANRNSNIRNYIMCAACLLGMGMALAAAARYQRIPARHGRRKT